MKGIVRTLIGLVALLVLALGCMPLPPPAPPDTVVPTPTNTPKPSPTPASSDTPVPTPTNTPTPFPTPIPSPSPTDTPVPPPPPPPTDTPVPPSPPPPLPDPLLIDNCEDGNNRNLLGGYWFTYDDRGSGGTSEVVPPAGGEFYCTAGGAQGTGFSAQMTGRVTTAYQYGFIGMGTNFAEPRAPRDISGYRGISFWAKGDGKAYRISFPQASIQDFDYYGTVFVAPQGWTQVTILFADLRQGGFGAPVPWTGTDVFGIQWQTVGQPHNSIFLAVDELRFLP